MVIWGNEFKFQDKCEEGSQLEQSDLGRAKKEHL